MGNLIAEVQIGAIDLTIIVVYLLGIVAVGCLAGLKLRQGDKGEDYFLSKGRDCFAFLFYEDNPPKE